MDAHMNERTRGGWLIACFVAVASTLGVACESSEPSAHALKPAGSESWPSADGKTPDEERQEAEEAARLSKLMAVRITNVDSTATCSPACGTSEQCVNSQCVPDTGPVEITADYLQAQLLTQCANEVIENTDYVAGVPRCSTPFAIAQFPCSECYTRMTACIANRLLDVAGLRASPLKVAFQLGGSFSVPVQSAPTNASLALMAREFSKFSADKVLRQLHALVGPSNDPLNCYETDLPNLAMSLVDHMTLYEQATDIAVENILATSDAQFGESPSLTEAAARAVAGGQLSRVSAAHLLVGGDAGLNGKTTAALCDDPQLTAQARRAVNVFRLAAVAPSDIVRDTLSLDDLLEGTGTPPVETCGPMDTTDCCTATWCDTSNTMTPIFFGSVRERLDEIYGAGLIAEVEALGVGQGVLGVSGLTHEDFEQARSYLRQEIAAFSRSMSALLPAKELVGGGFTTFRRFAGTATPAPERPAAYWAALASYEDHPMWVDTEDDPRMGVLTSFGYVKWILDGYGSLRASEAEAAVSNTLNEDLGPPGFGHVIGALSTAVRQVRNEVEDSAGLEPEIQRATLAALTPLAIQITQRYRGLVRMIYQTSSLLEIYIPNAMVASDVRVVVGEDGLSCATTGTIEGAPCDIDSPRLTLTSFEPAELDSGNRYNVANANWRSLIKSRLYFVERKGTYYNALGVAYAPNWGQEGQVFMPLVPEVLHRTATVLRPSRDWCTRPEVSCAGDTFDARIPLEDELSSDGDAVESSWRHYLTLARQSADEADLLGETVLNMSEQALLREEGQALAQIQRSEQAVEELQDICGASVDPSDLMRALSSEGTKDLSVMRARPLTCPNSGGFCAEECGTGNDCNDSGDECIGGLCMRPCDAAMDCSGMACIDGYCTWDPLLLVEAASKGSLSVPQIDRSNANRLWECLGGDTLERATLGSEALCIWQNESDPNRICEVPAGEMIHPCPIPLGNGEGATCAGMPHPEGTEPVLIPKDHALGLFVNGETGGGALDCNIIRWLRQDPGLVATYGPEGAAVTKSLLEQIAATEVFHKDRLNGLGAGLGWMPAYGGYSALTRGGAPLYSTGTTEGGASDSGWPCSDATLPEICAGDSGIDATSLFCVHAQCDDEGERAVINDRMMRAVIAAVDITGNPMNTVRLPVYYKINACDQSDGDSIVPCSNVETEAGCYVSTSLGVQSYWDPYQDGDETPFCYNTGIETEGEQVTLRSIHGTNSPLSVFLARTPPECEDPLPEGEAENVSCGTNWGRDYLFNVRGSTPNAWFTPGTPVVAYPEVVTSLITEDGGHSGFSGWRFGIEEMLNEPGWTLFSTGVSNARDYLFYGLSASTGVTRPIVGNEQPSSYLYRELNGTSRGLGSFADIMIGLPAPTQNDTWAIRYQADIARPIRVGIPAPFQYTQRNMLDGLELLCEMSHQSVTNCPSQPPVVASVEDLDLSQKYLQCLADQIEENLAMTILANVPSRAVLAMKAQAGVIGTAPVLGGTYGQRVNDLAVAVRVIRDTVPALADTVRSLATDMESVKIAITQANLAKDLASVNAKMTMINQQLAETQSIIGAIGGAVGGGASGASAGPWGAIAGAVVGAGVGIANTLAISDANAQMADSLDQAVALQGAIADTQVSQALNSLNAATNSRVRDMHDLSRELREAAGSLSTAITGIESERERAKRALYRGMLMDTDVMAAQFAATQFMRTRLSTARERYLDAHRNARRMAFFARRAIEQRLGEDLSVMDKDLKLVDAPSKWVDSICATSGVNLADDTEKLGENFADAYIGDYVTRLENVVESYRITNNFHEGDDTAIVSLRDDVMNVREECLAPVDNLLYHSSDLQHSSWKVSGCPALSEEPGADSIACAGVEALTGPGTSPFPVSWPDYGRSAGYRVTFGDATGNIPGSCPAATCFVGADTRIGQTVHLEQGQYRLSWYGRAAAYDTGESSWWEAEPIDMVELRSDIGVESNQVGTIKFGDLEGWHADDWTRYFVVFEVEEAGDVEVAIVPDPSVVGSQQVDMAAFMLEDLSAEPPLTYLPLATTPRPKPYMSTADTLEAMLPVCEDNDGSEFRHDHWRRRCMKLCRDGLRENCAVSSAENACYWETMVSIGQRDIDDGRILNLSGFARGNFNYRIASIGLNFVGTGTRDCEDSPTPSTCFSGGFIPYSIVHLGPYYVRNYGGEDYQAQLFTGRIEHARGLAAERYLTNPLGSADRELITPYLRSELNGRPLDGTFLIRVWEEEGVRFDGIEDVQLVLGYRYWTRFN